MKLTINAAQLSKYLFLSILVIAIGLRFFLAVNNAQANDDHYVVMKKIEKEESTNANDCWQCYHPKLYHNTGLTYLKLFGIEHPFDQITHLQLLNGLISIGTILLFWLFLLRLNLYPLVKILTFAFFALNPKFLLVSTQVSNDTLVIFLSTLGIFSIFSFYRSYSIRHLLIAAAAAFLATATKGSGLPLTLGIVAIAIVHLSITRMSLKKRSLHIVGLLLFCTLYSSYLFIWGSYAQNRDDKGSILAVNSIPPTQEALFFEDDHYTSSGVSSIFTSTFSFPFIDLMQNPQLAHGETEHPMDSRNSTPIHLYARAFSIQFSQYPWAIIDSTPSLRSLARLEYIFALFPFLISIAGFGVICLKTFRLLKQKRFGQLIRQPFWIPTAFVLGYLVMINMFAIEYRAYNFIKVIYIFPGILAFLYFTATGLQLFYTKITHQLLRNSVTIVFTVLCSLFIFDGLITGYKYSQKYTQAIQHYQGYVKHTTLENNQIWLTALPIATFNQRHFSPNTNRPFEGKQMQINGRTYPHGIGTHAESSIQFQLNKSFSTFSVGMGLNDTSKDSDGVQFLIWGDSTLLYDSEVVYYRDLQVTEVDVTDINILKIETRHVGRYTADHANWVDAILTKN